jgi:threonine/homoserine/homoserine lactone efflux protein
VADSVYGSIAAFGLTAISGLLLAHTFWLRLFGGLFLLYLGVVTLRALPADQPAAAKKGGLFAAFSSTFLLTLTNPMTILSFAAIFAGLGVGAAQGSYAASAMLVAGVFSGSLLWWLLLSGSVSLLKDRVTPQKMVWVNRGSGLIILFFGLVSLSGLL